MARPHYRYGSTDSPQHADGEALIGEGLVLTDNEDETPTNSETNLMQMSSLNGGLHHKISQENGDNNHNNGTNNNNRGLVGRMGDCWLEIQGSKPLGHVTRFILVLGIATCIFALLFILKPSSSDSSDDILRTRTAGGGSSTDTKPFVSPFPSIDRSSYGKSPSDIVNPNLFHPTLLHNSTKEAQPFLRVPFPTGAFWTNLVLKPISDRGFCYPVVAYPYAFKWNEKFLQASYPSVHRLTDKVSIHDAFIPDLTFGTVEAVKDRYITKFDPLSVTTRFHVENTGFWESYLVQGAPYITIKYEKATPIIRALSIFKDVMCPFDGDGNYNDENDNSRSLKWGVCTSTDKSTSGTKALHGVQFLLQTQEGLTWILFASEPIALQYDAIRKTTVTSTESFGGVLRLAIIPPSAGDDTKQSDTSSGSAPFSSSSGLRRLTYHASVYPVGGSVSWDFRSTSTGKTGMLNTMKTAAESFGGGMFSKTPTKRIAILNFNYETKSMTDDTNTGSNKVKDELLMLSLPHHAQSLKSDVLLPLDQFDLVYSCIKGKMVPVLGDSWSYEEPLTSIEFDDVSSRINSQSVHSEVRDMIMENVQDDLSQVLPTFDENIYGFGKQVARLAQLAHISNEIVPIASKERKKSANTTNPLAKVTQDAVQTLYRFLSRFLNNGVSDTLLYDVNFGGIVTKNGIVDSQADFGNGWYNDHHFHYGYILYACAIMGKLNSTFVSEYGSIVDAILYDVAHNANGDSQSADNVFFPLSRHKSWFDGHSFASGLFPFGNGKSQESSSEAVNCYYGAYLWSLVRYDADGSDTNQAKVDFAKLLLATEIRGARTYWHMIPQNTSSSLSSSTIYNPTLSKQYMVGNLGMLDVVCSTWFGTSPLYVHMINFMPVTAATSLLFNEAYVKEEYTAIIGPLLQNTEAAWKGYVIADHAIIDPSAAWLEAQELVSYKLDAGLSKSQLLYWISTRQGFQFSQGPSPNSPTHPSRPQSSTPPPLMPPQSAPPQSAPPQSTPQQSPTDKTNSKTESSQSCEANTGCESMGLSGLCCPTSDGTMLACCDKTR